MIERLKVYIKNTGLKKTKVAEELNISNVYLSYILNGKRECSAELEDRIRKLLR